MPVVYEDRVDRDCNNNHAIADSAIAGRPGVEDLQHVACLHGASVHDRTRP